MSTTKRPHVDTPAQKELDKLEQDFKKFDEQVKEVSEKALSADVPVQEVEPQTKLSQNQIRDAKDIYLKPHKTISCREKFNEKFRDDWNFSKEYVKFIAEHKEIMGDDIDLWTKPFAGVPAEEWIVPTNKPIWGPRYLAEQIQKKSYNRLVMDDSIVTSRNHMGAMTGQISVESKIKRLDAYPVSSKRSVFMNDGF